MAVAHMNDYNKYFDPEELISCPYNTAHTVTRKRMAIHLQKCRKQHEEVAKEFKACPFNLCHRIPRLEYHYHLETCADRQNFYTAQYKIGQVDNDIVPLLEMNIRKKIEVPCEENWDEEVTSGTNIIRSIEAQAKGKTVLENHTNMPKSERKQLREETRRTYREKLNEVEKKSTIEPACSSSSVSYPQNSSRAVSSRYSDDDDDNDDIKSIYSHASTRTDVSYHTAMLKANEKLGEFQVIERKRGKIGRGSKLATQMNVQPGIGRGQIRKEN